MFELVSPYKPSGDQPEAIEKLVKGIKDGKKEQVLLGATGTGKTFTVANVIKNVNKPTLVLAHNKTLAGQLYAELKELFPNNHVCFFISYYDYYQPEAYVPSSDTYIEKDASINDEIDELRHYATSSLISYQDVIVVASVSCIYGIGEKEEYEKSMLILSVGQNIKRNDIINRLVDMTYERNDLDFHRGTFRSRGDIIDVIPANEHEHGIRIELFGNEIERISTFDPLTGVIVSDKKTITISVYGSMPNTSLSVSEQYGQATLTTIPRASGVAAGEGYIEGTLPITIYRASSSFSHTLIYAFGGLTETIATGVGESYIWTIPTSFYTQIPNSPSGVGTITCQTYSGSTLIGTSSTTFTARCNAAVCSPTLYASLNDANSNTANLTGSTQTNPVLVDYKSNALFNVTCNAKNSASITSLKINGYSYAPTVSVITLTNIAFPSITIEAVDSRGFLAYYYFQCTDSSSNNYYKRIQYVNLTTSLSTKRSTQISDDMFVTIGGNYFKGNFSDNEPNTLSLSWKVREKNGEWINGTTALVPTISETENKYNISDLELVNPISTDGTWDYKKIYEFEFTAIDKLMTVVGSDSRPKGQPNFAIYKDVALMASGNPILDYEIIDEWED